MDKPIHPAAAILPLMVGDEFAALILDIRAHGLRDPIILHPDGSILDGRNRYRACEKAGVEPRYLEWKGAPGSEVAFVISENLHRRHLDAGQRAMFFARFATFQVGRPGHKEERNPNQFGLTNAEAAKAASVSERTIERARAIHRSGDEEMIRAVQAGEVDVTTAGKAVKSMTPKQIYRRKMYEKEKRERGIPDRGEAAREKARYFSKMNSAIEDLCSLPNPDDFIGFIKGINTVSSKRTIDTMLNKRLPTALRWLADFQQKWSAYVPARSKGSTSDES